MKIKVTADDITRGQRYQVGSCPIALAIIDAGFENVLACSGYARIQNSRIPLPEEANTFMLLFDANLPVQPFEFEFNARLPFFQRLKAALNEFIARLSQHSA